MADSRKRNQAARDRAKQQFRETQRRMAEELGDGMPVVASEEEADKIAVEWEKDGLGKQKCAQIAPRPLTRPAT